jgi:hypothetical protein
VLRDLGAVEPAIQALMRAVQLDSRLVDAERQARVLRSSKPAPDKPKTGLRGMFGGKK